MSENTLTKNLKVISYKDLPEQIGKSLRLEQRDCLNFAVKKFKIVGEAKIQTFQMGATIQGRGVISGGGAGYALTQNWNVFGGLGVIGLNQSAVNSFRTDVHLRLQEDGTNEILFLEKSIPMPITVSIAQGEEVEVYFARGGLSKPLMANDFKLEEWTPFFIKNTTTGQIIPLSALPSMLRPIKKMTAAKSILVFMGFIELAAGIYYFDNITARIIGFTFAFIFFLPGAMVALYNDRWRQKGLIAYRAAKEEAIAFELKNKSN